VKVTSVEVKWQTRGILLSESVNDDELFKVPEKIIQGNKLKELQVLRHFKHASLQIGDRAMYKITTDQVIHPQHVALGSLYCFKQPEPSQKAGGRQSQKQHSSGVERSTESVPSSNEERVELTEKVEKSEALKLEGDQELTSENLDENIDVGKDDNKRTFNSQEANEKEGTLISGEHDVSAMEKNDEEKCAEASANVRETSVQMSDGKVVNIDLELLCEIHRQLLEASDDIAKIGGCFKPLISNESGEAAEHMEQHIVRLLQSRNELHEQIALVEGLINGMNETPIEVKEKDSFRKAAEGHHLKTSAARMPKLRPGRNKKQPVTAGEEVCVEVTHTSTVVDVTWQVRLIYFFVHHHLQYYP
ncbi:uncharacterized protein LOC117099974, partial [Anneissia japonica]|uniref:uncharacterized protein LOC117099974 n=1 Tax=Anneissia japonica TaxID=1529436 RepID=UPI0014255719